MRAAKAEVRPQRTDWSVGRVFDRRPVGSGTRPTVPVHDGKCGANTLRATIVGNCRERSIGHLFTETADDGYSHYDYPDYNW